jgi:ketosteroid isomerase-like protein
MTPDGVGGARSDTDTRMSHQSADAAEHVQLLERMIELWNSGADALELLDPEIEVHTPFSSLTGKPYRGIAGYREWRADIADQFERWEMHIEEIRALSDARLLASGFGRVRGRGSGIELDQRAAGIVDFKDGRVARIGIYLSDDDALAAAGELPA